ncbi:DUF7674 family protein [Sphingobacterium sp. UBA3549]|uniref:DUF7674 family protein n=1 Tax=Sphingobacterium sp. UBA3549 TaxID=1947496 RepID=UPI003BEEF623
MALHYKEIRSEINFLLRKHNFAGVLQAVINHLRHLITVRSTDKICQHIEFLGTIYGHGNQYVKYILENLFVRSLGGLQRISTVHTWTLIEARLPVTFLEIRKGQQIHNLFISK